MNTLSYSLRHMSQAKLLRLCLCNIGYYHNNCDNDNSLLHDEF